MTTKAGTKTASGAKKTSAKAKAGATRSRARKPPPDPITVVIADDHRSFGEALEIVLDREDDLQVIEVVTGGTDAVSVADERHPDVVLVDVQMPDVDGIETTRRIRDTVGTGTAVIVLSGQDDDLLLARAIQAGARGYLPKTEAIGNVADAIRRAHRDQPLHETGQVEASIRRLRRRRAHDGDLDKRIDRLTPRELEILQLLADGATPEEIARDLGMSRHTFRTHSQNVLTKLGVHSKLDAIMAAIRYGKIRMPDALPADEDLGEPSTGTDDVDTAETTES